MIAALPFLANYPSFLTFHHDTTSEELKKTDVLLFSLLKSALEWDNASSEGLVLLLLSQLGHGGHHDLYTLSKTHSWIFGVYAEACLLTGYWATIGVPTSSGNYALVWQHLEEILPKPVFEKLSSSVLGCIGTFLGIQGDGAHFKDLQQNTPLHHSLFYLATSAIHVLAMGSISKHDLFDSRAVVEGEPSNLLFDIIHASGSHQEFLNLFTEMAAVTASHFDIEVKNEGHSLNGRHCYSHLQIPPSLKLT